MLLTLRQADEKGVNPSLFYLPIGQVTLVGETLFDRLSSPKEEDVLYGSVLPIPRIVSVEETDDLKTKIEGELKGRFDYLAVTLTPFSFKRCREMLEAFPGETIYVLCPELDGLSSRPLPFDATRVRAYDECFEAFVHDLVGLPPLPLPTPVTPVKHLEEEKKVIRAKLSFPNLKTQWITVVFGIIFLGLGLTTSVSYFFLREDSVSFFRVACIILAATFSLIPAVPLGFVYDDTHCRKPTDSLFFLFSYFFLSGLAFLFGVIVLALGNANAWPMDEVYLYVAFHFSTIIWMSLRMIFGNQLRAFREKRKKAKAAK